MEKVITRAEARTIERDKKIIAAWDAVRKNGTKLHAAAEAVADTCDVSVTTVNRVTRKHYGDKR